MSDRITTGNLKDKVEEVVKEDFSEIKDHLFKIESLVQHNISLDKDQVIELPGTDEKLKDIYSKLDELRQLIDILSEQVKNMQFVLDEFAQNKENGEL